MAHALDCCCYFTGFEALLNPVMLALKKPSQIPTKEKNSLFFLIKVLKEKDRPFANSMSLMVVRQGTGTR